MSRWMGETAKSGLLRCSDSKAQRGQADGHVLKFIQCPAGQSMVTSWPPGEFSSIPGLHISPCQVLLSARLIKVMSLSSPDQTVPDFSLLSLQHSDSSLACWMISLMLHVRSCAPFSCFSHSRFSPSPYLLHLFYLLLPSCSASGLGLSPDSF